MHDNNCFVIFCATFCLIQNRVIKTLKGVDKQRNGLYYLINVALKDLGTEFFTLLDKTLHIQGTPTIVVGLAEKLCAQILIE